MQMGWKKIKAQTDILAVHAALLPITPLGNVLILGGDEHDPEQAQPMNDSGEKKQAVLYDVSREAIRKIDGPGTDVFCCGHAFAGDGSFIIGGGTKSWDMNPHGTPNGHGHGNGHDPENYAAFHGETQCWRLPLFGPNAMRWEDFGNFKHGRWYPGMITLADGSIMAISGKPQGEDLFNKIPEISGLDAEGKPVWVPIELENPDEFEVHYYPRCHLFPIGREGSVFICVAKIMNEANSYCSVRLKKDDISGKWRYEKVAELEEGKNYQQWYFASTVLPQLFGHNFKPRILICNGTTPQIYITDENEWVGTSSRSRKMQNFQRRHGMATLLPNGQIFLNGGINGLDENEENAVMEAEIFSAEINWARKVYRNNSGYWEEFQKEHTGSVVRNYHSTALLLPDGSVWTAGSSREGLPGKEHGCLDIEIYYPDYFHSPGRLNILGFGQGIGLLEENDFRGVFYYGTDFFEVIADYPDKVGGVVLTRLGSSTHAGNFDQRLLVMDYTIAEEKVRVNTREIKGFSSHTAPPGWYMIWLLDEYQIPCNVAKFIFFTHKNTLNDKT